MSVERGHRGARQTSRTDCSRVAASESRTGEIPPLGCFCCYFPKLKSGWLVLCGGGTIREYLTLLLLLLIRHCFWSWWCYSAREVESEGLKGYIPTCRHLYAWGWLDPHIHANGLIRLITRIDQQFSILSSVKRSEQRSESHGNLAAKNRRQMCHADEFSVEIWDNVFCAESQNSLNFGGFILIVLVSACCFSFSFGYSSLKPFCNPAVTPAMRIWRAKRWVTKHSRPNLKLETFSCNICHSQLLKLNNNTNFLVAFIKVIFRKADSKRKCL